MDWRPLGTTGLRVTPIGLGLAALGRPAYINVGRDRDLGTDRGIAVMKQRCHDVLDAAYADGVGYVDAARSYGLAEAFLKSWLKARPGAKSPPTVRLQKLGRALRSPRRPSIQPCTHAHTVVIAR